MQRRSSINFPKSKPCVPSWFFVFQSETEGWGVCKETIMLAAYSL